MQKTGMSILPLTVIMLLLLLPQLPTVVAEQFQYVGNKKCIACHRAEFQSWQKDSHSRALDTLKPGTKGEAKIKGNLIPRRIIPLTPRVFLAIVSDMANLLLLALI